MAGAKASAASKRLKKRASASPIVLTDEEF
jgi:hypothetical protein